ncbi:MAG: sulfite exporter TauE/SafE family protein [Planctomycetota bacterium]
MIEWPLIFTSGLLGSAHCIGMCGGFAWMVGQGSKSAAETLQRQLAFTLGRVFTYASLGATAGFLGQRLSASAPGLARWQAGLAIAAGIVLVLLGGRLLAVHWPPRRTSKLPASSDGRRSFWAATSCVASSFYGGLIRRHGRGGSFLAGLFTGWLPCGLVYAMLTLSASTASLGEGALTMALFGLGTAPAMVLFGLSSRWLTATARRRVFAAAAVCILITGGLSIGRGVHSWQSLDASGRPACPACEAESVADPAKVDSPH